MSDHLKKQEPNAVGIVRFAIGFPYFVVVGTIILVIMGLLAVMTMPKDLLPVGNNPAVQILTFYPGMPTDVVEKDITSRVELYTIQAVGIRSQESRSLPGVSVVKNYFNPEISLDNAIAQTSSLLSTTLRKLPPGTQPPLILPFDPAASTPLALVTISGDAPEKVLRDLGRYDVSNTIKAIPGAMAPVVMGGTDRQILVLLDPERVRKFHFSPLDVLERMLHLNALTPSGEVSLGDQDLQIVGNSLAESAQEMNQYPLRSFYGKTIRVKDIGEVKDAQAIQTNVVMVGDKRQVYVPVFRQPGANSLAVVDELKDQLSQLNRRLKGVVLKVVADQSDFIRHAIHSIGEEAAIGGGLAALMVFLFLGNPTATVGILLSLPFALLFAFLGLKISGQTLNAMTLGGLALSIGVLVDNAIVVIENISRKLKDGLEPMNAAIRGASEVAMPVLSSTLCTMVVLFPVVLLEGISKTLFTALSISVIFAMIGSYLAAMTLIPLFASKFLSPREGRLSRMGLLRVCTQAIERASVRYESVLNHVLNRKKVLLSAAVALVVAGIFGAGFLGTELFPRADAGHFIVRLKLPAGTRLEKTEEVARSVIQKLDEVILPGDLEQTVSNIGLIQGLPAAYTSNAGPHDLFLIVQLSETRKKTSQEYARILREKIPEWVPHSEVSFELGGLLSSAMNAGLPAPLDIQVSGPDVRKAFALAQDILPQISKMQGVVDARIQQRFDAPLLRLSVDRAQVSDHGLELDSVMKDVVSSVNGSPAFSQAIWVDPKTGIDYPFGVRMADRSFSTLDDLKKIPINGPLQDRAVPLRSIATIQRGQGASEIGHRTLIPTIDLFVSTDGRDVGSVAREINQKIVAGVKDKLENGYDIRVLGEYQDMMLLASRFALGFILAAILVYLFLVIQFKSFSIPAVAMAAVPCGAAGMIGMLLATHTYFSIQAGIGAIFMIGIAVANAVILLEFILHQEHEFPRIRDAVLHAARARFRPILMTTLASVLGLVPMALGLGKGSEANIPLGRAVIGGQLVSTAMTLFLVPTLFEMLRTRQARKQQSVLHVVAPVALLLLVLLPWNGFAASRVLTVGEFIGQGLKVDPGLLAQRFKMAEEQAKEDEAKGRYFPEISLQGLLTTGFPGSAGATNIEGLVVSPYHSGPSVGVVAKHTVYDFGRTDALIDEYSSKQKAEGSRLDANREGVAERLSRLFYACVFHRSWAEDLVNYEKQGRKIADSVAEYVGVGQRSMVERQLSQSQVQEIQSLREEEEISHQSLQKQMAILLADEKAEAAIPQWECPQADTDHIPFVSEQDRPQWSPEVELREQELAAAQAELRRAKLEFAPKIVALGSTGFMQGTELGFAKQGYAFALGITIPLFDGMRKLADVHQSIARKERLEHELAQEKREFALELQRLELARETLAVRSNNLESEWKTAKSAFDTASGRFNAFKGNLTDLRESFRNLLRIQHDRRETQREVAVLHVKTFLMRRDFENQLQPQVAEVK